MADFWPASAIGYVPALVTNGHPPCWGIGAGRTGTSSLCTALRILGYLEVRHNPVFEDLADLQGGADSGVVIFYKYLDYKHPGSKFVLTLRDVESWLQSVKYIFERHPVTSRKQDVAIMRRMLLGETVCFDREKLVAARAAPRRRQAILC